MYKTDDCSGVANVNGLTEKNGVLNDVEKFGNKFRMREDEWGGQVQSIKLHKDLQLFTFSDWEM